MDFGMPATAKARLVTVTDDPDGGTSVDVHFNPASLVYTVENSTKQAAGQPTAQQFAGQFSAKLSMDLQFDTTDSGSDVRLTTSVIAGFMHGSNTADRTQSGASAQAQPLLRFEWGSYEFTGAMESFKEVIDFFSADGVPLRSLVSLGLSEQAPAPATSDTADTSGSVVPTGADSSATGLAALGGDPAAARQLGADNGLDSLRFSAGASLEVNAGVQLNPAVGFSASSGFGIGIGGGAGASIGGSFGLSDGGGASIGLSAGAGGGAIFGGQASAGVAATAGAFAGLETGRATASSTARLNPLRMIRSTVATDVTTGMNASFGLGGTATAPVGFGTNVGANFNLGDALAFDGD